MRAHQPIVIFALALLLAACGERGAPQTTTPTTTPQTGGTLTLALQADGTTLDPHAASDAGSQRLVENLYAGLMRYSDTYPEVEPDLLADYSASDDFKTFDLTLKTGLTFHSGNALTAEDVKYSLQRMKRMDTAYLFDHLASIDVRDDTHLTLRFSAPMSPLKTYLANPMFAIVDREVVQANDGDLSRADAGAGPFKLVTWRKGRRLEMEKFADYHVDDRPRLDRVIYRPIPDTAARRTALVNREADVVLDVPLPAVDPMQQRAGLTVESVPGTFWEYIGLNTNKPPFDDAKVRRAVAWAIDREALNEAVKYGRARVITDGPLPPHHWAHANLNTYPQPDPRRARQLLDAAGHGDGLDAELIVGADFAYQVQAAGLIKQMLKPVGIHVTVTRLESGQFFSRLNQGGFQMTVVGWVGHVDPDQFFATIFHSDGRFNQQHYANRDVDQRIEAGRRTADRDNRREVYTNVQRHIARDAPTVFLYVTDQITAYHHHVGGFNVHPTGTTISLRDAWVGR